MRSRPRSTFNAFLVAAAAMTPALAFGADVVKANNTTNLNLGTTWVGGVVPGAGDVAVFDSTYATTGVLNTGALVAWSGIRIASPGGAVIINNSTANTQVALGSAGIDMSAATVDLTIQRVRVDASQTWNVAAGRTFRLGNSITARTGQLTVASAGYTVTKTGAGAVDIDTGNASLGAVNWRLEDGVVRVIWNEANAWGTGTLTLAGGGAAVGTPYAGSVGNWTWNNAISLASGTSSFIDNQNNAGNNRWLKLTGVMSGSGNIEYRDTGSGFDNSNYGFVIVGNNTNTGTVTIAANTELRVGGLAPVSSTANTGNLGKLAADSALVVNNGQLSFSRLDSHTVANSISGTGQIRVGLVGTVGTSTATQSVTFTGDLSTSGVFFVFNGSSTLTGSNTHSGGTELQGGTLTASSLDNAGGVGSIGTGYLAIKAGSTFNYTGGSVSTSRSLFMDNGAANFNVTDADAVVTWSDGALKNGAFTKGGAGTLALSGAFSPGASVTVNAGTLSLSGANTYTAGTVIASDATLEIAGNGSLAATTISGSGSLRMAGTGTLTLSSTSNSFTGGTTVTSGTLALGAAGVLADTGAVTVSGGILDLGAFAETVGSVALSSGVIQNGTLTSAADFELTGGSVDASVVLDGLVGLTKTGAGSATVAGSHSYTGSTSIAAGTLVLAAGTTLASTAYVIGDGATLETADAFTLGAGITLGLGSGNSVASANQTGDFTLDGGTLSLDFGASTNDLLAVTGDITLNSGTLAFSKVGSYSSGTFDVLTYGGVLNGDPVLLTLSGLSSDGTSRQTFDLVHEELAQKLQLVVGGKAEAVVWTGGADTVWNAGGDGSANWLVTDPEYSGDQPDKFFNGDTVTFDDTVADGTVEIDLVDVLPGSVEVNNSVVDFTIGGIGVIASGALTKSGSASLTLASANTYSGGTNLQDGRIRLGVDNALGSGAVTLLGGALSSDSTDARTLANTVVVSGDASLGDVTDSGTLTLSGTVDLDASTRVLTLLSDAVLSGVVSNGSLEKAGAGRLTFTGNNVLRVALDVSSGTAALGSDNAVNDSVDVTVRDGATLDLGGFSDTVGTLTLDNGATVTAGNLTATTVTVSGTALGATLVGSTALVKNGTTILDLTAASLRSGATTLSSGGIRVADNAALGTGTLALNGGRLTADATGRTLANATTVGGDVTLGETGAGLLTFSNTFNLGGGNRTLTVDSDVRLSGVVSNGTLTKAGNGTLTLSANNSHSGGTVIQAGRVEMVGTVNSLGSGGVTLSDGAELALSMGAANVTIANAFTGTGRVAKNTTNRFFITGDNSNAVIEWYWASNDPAGTTGGLGFANGAAFGGAGSKLRVDDGITASAFINASGQTVAVGVEIDAGGTYQWNGSTANTNTITGVISGSGTFTKISGETLLFTGVHTHTGALNVSGGTMQIGQSGQLGEGDFVGATTLTGTLYYNSDAAQTISGAVSGTGTLRKGNTSTLVLSGANTHTGQTSVEQGTVQLTGSQIGASNTARVINLATVAGQSASYVVDGGSIALTGTNSLIVGDVGTGTFTLSSGSVSMGSGGVWIGDASATAVGTLDIQGGTFDSSGAVVVGTRGTGTLNVSGGTATFASISLGHSAGTGQTANVNLGAATVVTGSITGVANATTRELSLDGATLRATASTTTYLQGLTAASLGNGGVNFDTNGFDITVAQDLLLAAIDPGVASISKSGLGTLTLSGSNAHDGGTTVNAGTLRAGSASAFGLGVVTVLGGSLDLGGQTLANDVVLDGGALAGAGTLTGDLTAASGLTKADAGTLTLSGSNTVASVAITGGTLVAGSASALGSGTITLGGGTLDLGGQTLANAIVVQSGGIAGSGTISGSISGAGNLAKTGEGDLELAGVNTYGATTLSAGTLRLSGSGTLGLGSVTVTGGTLDLNGVAVTKDIALSGGALVGASDLSGTVTVNVNSAASGSLSANLALGTDDTRILDITGGLDVTGTLSGVGTLTGGDLTISGTHAVGNSPGYQLIEGNATYGASSLFVWEFEDDGTFDIFGPNRPTLGAPGNYDAVDVTGDLIVSAGAILQLSALFTDPFSAYTGALWNAGTDVTFQVFSVNGTIDGLFTFADGSLTEEVEGFGSWTIRREIVELGETTGVYLSYAPIPEPSTYGLMLGGLALAAAAWRRRRAK